MCEESKCLICKNHISKTICKNSRFCYIRVFWKTCADCKKCMKKK